MAPEILSGYNMEALVSVDVWSLGCILYELLTGERLFKGKREEIVRKVLKAEVNYPDFLSKESENLIKEMLKIHVDDRIIVKDILNHPWIKGEKLEILDRNLKINDNKEYKQMDTITINTIDTIERVIIHPLKRRSSSLDDFFKNNSKNTFIDKLKENPQLDKFATIRDKKFRNVKSKTSLNKRNFT